MKEYERVGMRWFVFDWGGDPLWYQVISYSKGVGLANNLYRALPEDEKKKHCFEVVKIEALSNGVKVSPIFEWCDEYIDGMVTADNYKASYRIGNPDYLCDEEEEE